MSFRKIVVDGTEYRWKYGRSCIPIRRGDKMVACPTVPEMTGMSWAEIERADWKEHLHITPGTVAEYIKKNL